MDSLQNPVVIIADFVAGVIRVTYAKKNLQFKEFIKEFIVEERIHKWREIKKR
jgi:hypothetical protein